jgi:hypothetical protein
MSIRLAAFVVTAALSVGVCCADIITASSAGPLLSSAEDLSSSNSVNGIIGSLYISSDGSPYPDFESVFKIHILNYLSFSAETVPVGAHGITDSDLFLFDASGHGIYMNDDASGSNTLSCLPSATSSNPCSSSRNGVGPTSNGIYYLAIANSANYPTSSTGEIFSPISPTDVVGADLTAGGAAPFSGWDDGAFANPNFDQVAYDIVLTGTTPEPATWLLIAVPLCALVLLRKRLAASTRT